MKFIITATVFKYLPQGIKNILSDFTWTNIKKNRSYLHFPITLVATILTMFTLKDFFELKNYNIAVFIMCGFLIGFGGNWLWERFWKLFNNSEFSMAYARTGGYAGILAGVILKLFIL